MEAFQEYNGVEVAVIYHAPYTFYPLIVLALQEYISNYLFCSTKDFTHLSFLLDFDCS